MTVKELIEKLQQFPQDYDVVRGDMEYGPFYINTVKIYQDKDYPQTILIGTSDD